MKTNSSLKKLALNLYKSGTENNTNIWRKVADDLLLPRRNKRAVNVFKLSLFSKDGDVVVVPGKVLGTGDISHKVTVAAQSFSRSAIDKIKNAKGNVMSIQELAQKNPKGKDVKVFG